MSFEDFIKGVKYENAYAVGKHPEFPKDLSKQVLVLIEEAGEVAKAANDIFENKVTEKEGIENLKTELLQTAQSCYRILLNLLSILIVFLPLFLWFNGFLFVNFYKDIGEITLKTPIL